MGKARLTALASVLVLAACGGAEDRSAEATADGNSVSANISSDDGTLTAQVRGDDGQTIDIRSDPSAPVTLPDGFSLFPGAEVKSNTKMAMGAGSAAIVSFDVDARPDEIVDYYRKEAEAAGFSIRAEASANASRSIAGEAGSGDGFQLSVDASGDGSTATLMVGRGMGE